MILLKNILLESAASEEAKKLGLKSIGFGRYVKPNEPKKVVAKSVNGKLQMVGGKEEPKEDPSTPGQLQLFDPKGKPQNVGQTTFDDLDDKCDERGFARKEIISGEQTIIWPADVGNIFLSKGKGNDPNVNRGSFEYAKFTGRSLTSLDFREEKLAKLATKLNNQYAVAKEYSSVDAERQNNWRQEVLLPSEQSTLIDIQTNWQETSHWNSGNEKWMNKQINEMCAKEKPPTVDINEHVPYIERGMKIDDEHVENFLSNFRIGKDVILPPSGFSARPDIARTFTKPGYASPGNIPRGVSVLLRLKPQPKSDTLVGLHLSNVDENSFGDAPTERDILDDEPVPPDIDGVRDNSDLEEPLSPNRTDYDTDESFEEASIQYDNDMEEYNQNLEDEYNQALEEYDDLRSDWETEHDNWQMQYGKILDDEYGYEREIIRPGNVKQKVTNVTKHIFPITQRGRPQDLHKLENTIIIYEIEMEDAGMVDRELWAEQRYMRELALMVERDSLLKKAQSVLKKYINNRVAREPRKPSKYKILSKYTNTSIGKK